MQRGILRACGRRDILRSYLRRFLRPTYLHTHCQSRFNKRGAAYHAYLDNHWQSNQRFHRQWCRPG